MRDYDKAEPEFQKALAIYESKIGPDHAATISTLNNLAMMILRSGDLAGSEEIFRQILERYERKYGSDHQIIADTYQNLATALTRQGHYEESIPMHRKAAEVYDRVLLGDHFVASYPQMSLAYAYIRLGEFPAAGEKGPHRSRRHINSSRSATLAQPIVSYAGCRRTSTVAPTSDWRTNLGFAL